MRWQTGLAAGCLLWALMGIGARECQGAVAVKRINYHGWAGSYQLSNGTVELVFVPQIGRIMRYGYVGGVNLLWENLKLRGKTTGPLQPYAGWINFGGDKLWPAPQARWNWPPDPTLDRGAHTVQVLSGNRLLVTGKSSPKVGIRFVREITMEATGTGVTVKNTMTNTSDQDVEWAVWEVAQMDDPEEMRLPLHTKGKFPRGYYVFKEGAPQPGTFRAAGDVGLFRRHAKKASKIGADSPTGALSADKQGLRFTIRAAYVPGENYPDDGCGQEIYTNPDPDKYVELELLSPIQFLQPGDSYTFTTHWRLTGIRD